MSQSLFDLSGRVAVVTGGTTGIGHAIALGLAQSGADVVASSRRSEQVEKVAGEIEGLGRKTLRMTSDVLDRSSLEKLHDEVMKRFGKVDILVNAAGVTHKSPTLEETEAEWSRVMETNLTGTLRACQIFGKTMVKAGYGRIVNIASLTTFVAFYQVGAYAASKAAVGSLIFSQRRDVEHAALRALTHRGGEPVIGRRHRRFIPAGGCANGAAGGAREGAAATGGRRPSPLRP